MVKQTLHLKAPGNWINDPNGFIFYQGKYHLFYQYFPYAPLWGTMHWGHAVSPDLIHWEHLGVALFPTIYEDQNGCFSGSALEYDGKLNLYYTGIHYKKAEPGNIHACADDDFQASQLMISSEDGIHFDNFSGKRIVVPVIENEEIGDSKDTRDPKVWQEDGNFYMILGSTYRKETGRTVIYKSKDARSWEYAAQLRSARFGKILECPDIFKLGNEHVFMGSPMYIEEDAGGYEHHAVCMTAGFDAESCTLTLQERYQYVDYGLDLYAPQTNVDKDGRRVMIAWFRMPKAVEEPGKEPWIGMMSLPRVVEVMDGHIYFRVHPEVEKYFVRKRKEEKSLKIRKMPDCPFRIKTELEDGETLNIGGYRIWRERGFVKTDRSAVFAGIEGHRLVSTTPKVETCRLDIFVDKNLIEVFVNEGQYVVSNVVYELGSQIDGRIEELWEPREEKGGQGLYGRFEFRNIRPQEAEEAAEVERICFPPHEACSREMMLKRAQKAPELFLAAIDKQNGKIAGFLNGLSTDEDTFRDEFFTSADLYNPEGKNIMLLGLDVLPEYRNQGLARELMRIYCLRERKNGRRKLLLTCLPSKVRMYERMGFLDEGIADSLWGGEKWHEMSYKL